MLPSGASFDSSNQTLSWTPTYTQAGDYEIKVTVTDDGEPNISVSKTFKITVNNVNAPPKPDAGPDKSGVNGETIRFERQRIIGCGW